MKDEKCAAEDGGLSRWKMEIASGEGQGRPRNDI